MNSMTKTPGVGPLTAADLDDAIIGYGEEISCWTANGFYRHPMAAESSTEEGADQPKRVRRMHWAVAVPVIGVLLTAFFIAFWASEFMPSRQTTRILAMIVIAPACLASALWVLARWLR